MPEGTLSWFGKQPSLLLRSPGDSYLNTVITYFVVQPLLLGLSIRGPTATERWGASGKGETRPFLPGGGWFGLRGYGVTPGPAATWGLPGRSPARTPGEDRGSGQPRVSEEDQGGVVVPVRPASEWVSRQHWPPASLVLTPAPYPRPSPGPRVPHRRGVPCGFEGETDLPTPGGGRGCSLRPSSTTPDTAHWGLVVGPGLGGSATRGSRGSGGPAAPVDPGAARQAFSPGVWRPAPRAGVRLLAQPRASHADRVSCLHSSDHQDEAVV